ncbi:MAG: protein-export chaperone SecB [Pseudomonadota bacterium]
MSETPPNGGGAPDQGGDQAAGAAAGSNAGPSLRVLAQYLKDHSFENPKAPQSFIDNGVSPNIDVNVDVAARALGNDQYEVELSARVGAKRGADTAFVVETTYAGLFEIKNVPEDQLEPIMIVECPRLLFPFLRQIVAETTTTGNFPPIMLDPIDFFSLYQQRKIQSSQQAAQA